MIYRQPLSLVLRCSHATTDVSEQLRQYRSSSQVARVSSARAQAQDEKDTRKWRPRRRAGAQALLAYVYAYPLTIAYSAAKSSDSDIIICPFADAPRLRIYGPPSSSSMDCCRSSRCLHRKIVCGTRPKMTAEGKLANPLFPYLVRYGGTNDRYVQYPHAPAFQNSVPPNRSPFHLSLAACTPNFSR